MFQTVLIATSGLIKILYYIYIRKLSSHRGQFNATENYIKFIQCSYDLIQLTKHDNFLASCTTHEHKSKVKIDLRIKYVRNKYVAGAIYSALNFDFEPKKQI